MQTNPIYILIPQNLKLFPLETIQFHVRHNTREEQKKPQAILILCCPKRKQLRHFRNGIPDLWHNSAMGKCQTCTKKS